MLFYEMNIKLFVKFTAVAVIASGVVIGRILHTKSVSSTVENHDLDQDDSNDERYNPIFNETNENVIDPRVKTFTCPQLILNGLRKNMVDADVDSWEGNQPRWLNYKQLRVAGVLASGWNGQVMYAFDDEECEPHSSFEAHVLHHRVHT